MGILNNIEVSLHDTINITTTPREVILHSCHSTTSSCELFIVITICLTILLSLIIIALTVVSCIRKNNNDKLNELKNRRKNELNKLEKESQWKERKDRYDSAWRTIEHAWKESGKKQDDPNVEKAWNYITSFLESEVPARNSNSEKSEQSKS